MFKPRSMTNLITPMRHLNMFTTPTITTTAQDRIPTPFEKRLSPEPIDNQSTKNHIEKPQKTQNTSKKDKTGVLVGMLFDLNDSKEAVYGALDAWVASEREFPIGRLKAALVILERKREWHRIVQVIKWMLSKGQGVTVGTYGQLIHALDMDRRVEEAHRIWVQKLGRDNAHSVPWKVCNVMISAYHRNGMNIELVRLFKGLEAHGRKPPDESVLRKVAESYEKLGLFEEKERVLEKYKILFSEKRGKHGRRLLERVSKSAGAKPSLKTDEVTETC